MGENQIAWSKVQTKPYSGWVSVVVLPPPHSSLLTFPIVPMLQFFSTHHHCNCRFLPHS